jgi:hypothetical protein
MQDVSDAEQRLRTDIQDEQTARANTLAHMQAELNAAIAEDLRLLRLKMLDAEEMLRLHFERLAAGEERRRVHINAVRAEQESLAGEVRRAATAMSNASASRSRFVNSSSVTSMMTSTTMASTGAAGRYFEGGPQQLGRSITGVSPLAPRPQTAGGSYFFSPNPGEELATLRRPASAAATPGGQRKEVSFVMNSSAAAGGGARGADMSLLHAAQLPEGAAEHSRRRFKSALMNEALSKPV